MRNVLHGLMDPFEIFYQKNQRGVWYYIGTYRAFYICDAPYSTWSWCTEQEVDRLVRNTIKGPESPKLKKDVDYLRRVRLQYSEGALEAAYVGVQCVGRQKLRRRPKKTDTNGSLLVWMKRESLSPPKDEGLTLLQRVPW
ncbi:hypothetical protein K439DRAFT_620378 [Ramaria rubella]|nr:hypothetical protein K439DRAFT_620378 [Ramaria rubella]